MEQTMKIGELARKAGVTTRTIRYYEELGMIKPCKLSCGGFRLYSTREQLKLRLISHLKELNLPLDKIKQILCIEETNFSYCHSILNILEQQLFEANKKLSDFLAIDEQINISGKLLECCQTCEKKPSYQTCSVCEEIPEGELPLQLKALF